jgi:hypothetical protein
MLLTSKEFFYLPIEDWARLVQTAAIIVGGIAAYIKWFRGRLYETRLEISVVGSLVEASPPQIVATARLKNVGLSRVPIEQAGSGFRVFSAIPTQPQSELLSVGWKREGTFSVFQQHGWIESNETIEDQLLVTVPEGRQGTYRIEVWVASKGIVWKASGIAYSVKDVHNK